MHKINLKVSGMHCGACSTAIEMYLSNKEGVSLARVNFDTKEAEVEIDESKVKPEDIIKAIEEIGFASNLILSQVDIKKP